MEVPPCVNWYSTFAFPNCAKATKPVTPARTVPLAPAAIGSNESGKIAQPTCGLIFAIVPNGPVNGRNCPNISCAKLNFCLFASS